MISVPTLEAVEFVDTDQNQIGALKSIDGSLVKNADMINNQFFCTVGMDDLASIFVAGGQLSGR